MTVTPGRSFHDIYDWPDGPAIDGRTCQVQAPPRVGAGRNQPRSY